MRAVQGGIRSIIGAAAAAFLVLATLTFWGTASAGADTLIPCLVQGTQINTCQLTFVAQPTDAKAATRITSVPGNPNGAPVQVKVSFAGFPVAGVAVTLTPTGKAATSDSNGLATFDGTNSNLLAIASDGRYAFTANANNSTPTTSNGFTVYDDATYCSANTACTASASSTDGTTTVTASVAASQNPSGGALFVSEGLDAVSCTAPNGSQQAAQGVATTDSTFSGSGYKTVTVRVDKSVVKAVDPSDPNGASKFQVCYQSNLAVPTGTLLPDCGTSAPPCVSHRSKNQAGDAIIELHLPLSDPKFGWCIDGSTCVSV